MKKTVDETENQKPGIIGKSKMNSLELEAELQECQRQHLAALERENEMNNKLRALERHKADLEELVESKQREIKDIIADNEAASASSEPCEDTDVPSAQASLDELKQLVEDFKNQCKLAEDEEYELGSKVNDAKVRIQIDSNSLPELSQRITSLLNTKKSLDHDRAILLAQIANVVDQSHVSYTLSGDSTTSLSSRLVSWIQSDKELRELTLAFVMKSRDIKEKENMKKVILMNKLPLDTDNESNKYHLSVAQRVQHVEVKISTAPVVAPRTGKKEH